MRRLITFFIPIFFLMPSCKTFSKAKLGEIVGQKTGTVVGSVVGDAAGNEVAGTMIGGSLGAATGDALVKSSLEKQADEISSSIREASVSKSLETLTVSFRQNSLFQKNKGDSLTLNAGTMLDRLATILKKYPANKIAIYATNPLSRRSGQSLTNKRETILKEYLQMKGVEASRITLGEAEKGKQTRLISIIIS